jgi:serine/threonine-protein kinase
VTVLRSSELVGRVVGGRYRLLRAVGSGASAHVYVAEDVRLRRRVALKVLHPALAEDKSFLRRFQAEAQTVAALRHPGIVRVYDWGEDGGAAYLAMELLEGGSLRALLDRGYRLNVSQAAALGLDVAAALAYAHSRGLVHRDVKPANLLFDEEGHASVADFGIARALAEASWTEPMGALVGTARYAAPEQLRGRPLDGRADVYALAVVLVEAVTGTVPFARDTVLAALLARADQSLPVPAELGPLVPVLEQGGTADPEQRLNAESVAHAIALVARQLRAPAPLPLPGLAALEAKDLTEPTAPGSGARKPRDSGLSILVGDLPVVVPDPVVADPPEAALPQGAPGAAGSGATPVAGDFTAAPPDLSAGLGRGDPAVATVDAAVAMGDAGADLGRTERPGTERQGRARARYRRRWLRRLLLAVVTIALVVAAVGADLYLTAPAPTYSVPGLQGDTLTAARLALSGEHLTLTVAARQWSSVTKKGLVVSQVPVRGTVVQAKQTVAVTVSLGPEPVPVPSLATFDVVQASSVLKGAGLRLGKVTSHASWTVPNGIIISWSDKADKLPPHSAINVVVSTGDPTARVPSFGVGTTYSQAEGILSGLGFQVREESYYRNATPLGVVLSTAPPAGAVLVVGTRVTVNVSAGPHLVTIPSSVLGLTGTQAANVLYSLGLYVSATQGSPLASVTATEPAVGAQVLYGSSIVLVTG